jgi:uncharacterized protein (DUF2336 family)
MTRAGDASDEARRSCAEKLCQADPPPAALAANTARRPAQRQLRRLLQPGIG